MLGGDLMHATPSGPSWQPSTTAAPSMPEPREHSFTVDEEPPADFVPHNPASQPHTDASGVIPISGDAFSSEVLMPDRAQQQDDTEPEGLLPSWLI